MEVGLPLASEAEPRGAGANAMTAPRPPLARLLRAPVLVPLRLVEGFDWGVDSRLRGIRLRWTSGWGLARGLAGAVRTKWHKTIFHVGSEMKVKFVVPTNRIVG